MYTRGCSKFYCSRVYCDVNMYNLLSLSLYQIITYFIYLEKKKGHQEKDYQKYCKKRRKCSKIVLCFSTNYMNHF